MRLFLLDTCVVSELVKPSPAPRVVDWVRDQSEDRLYLSVLTLGEIRKGIERLAQGERRRRLQRWIDEDLTQRFFGRLWPVDQEVALHWGELQGQAQSRGRTLSVVDGLIAATASIHRAAVVTRNVDDIQPAGVSIVNPWVDS